MDQIALLGQMSHHAVWLSDLLSRRRSGRVDDEGNDLLLNSERGTGGVMVRASISLTPSHPIRFGWFWLGGSPGGIQAHPAGSWEPERTRGRAQLAGYRL